MVIGCITGLIIGLARWLLQIGADRRHSLTMTRQVSLRIVPPLLVLQRLPYTQGFGEISVLPRGHRTVQSLIPRLVLVHAGGMDKPPALVYVDGFNLYKGQLESRPANKWLDLVALFDDVLDDFDVQHVHYFTARIKGRMNPEDPKAPDRQDAYIRALRTLRRLTVHDDSLFTVHHGDAREWIDGKEQPPLTRHHVYKVQEKGSDVKLATQLLMDSLDGLAQTYVVVSSDSDLARPIEVAKQRLGARVGVLYPRDARTKLFERAGVDFSLYLRPAFAARNQLPDVVQTPKRPVHRPPSWK